MRNLLLTSIFILLSLPVLGQETEQALRFNLVNPGLEYEQPVTQTSTLSANIGIGYSGSYPVLTITTFGTGVNYVIAPFGDIQYRKFYNLKKRAEKNKITNSNSGNFISIRFRTRGKSIDDNIVRTTDWDFAFGPTWGIQRRYGSFHMLFDVGPQYYFDTEGNSGFWPLMPQINLGVDL